MKHVWLVSHDGEAWGPQPYPIDLQAGTPGQCGRHSKGWLSDTARLPILPHAPYSSCFAPSSFSKVPRPSWTTGTVDSKEFTPYEQSYWKKASFDWNTETGSGPHSSNPRPPHLPPHSKDLNQNSCKAAALSSMPNPFGMALRNKRATERGAWLHALSLPWRSSGSGPEFHTPCPALPTSVCVGLEADSFVSSTL